MSIEPYRPKTVGDVGVYVVGVEGVITAIGDSTITIGGHTLPTRMSDTVKYLSVVWPDEDGDEGCLLEHRAPGSVPDLRLAHLPRGSAMSRRTQPCRLCSGRTRHANRICSGCRIQIAYVHHTAHLFEPRMPTRSAAAAWWRGKSLATLQRLAAEWEAAQLSQEEFMRQITNKAFERARREQLESYGRFRIKGWSRS